MDRGLKILFDTYWNKGGWCRNFPTDEELAQAKAGEILAAAQKKSREMRKAAQDFVDDLMTRADEQLTANLNEVKKTRAALRQQIPSANQTQD